MLDSSRNSHAHTHTHLEIVCNQLSRYPLTLSCWYIKLTIFHVVLRSYSGKFLAHFAHFSPLLRFDKTVVKYIITRIFAHLSYSNFSWFYFYSFDCVYRGFGQFYTVLSPVWVAVSITTVKTLNKQFQHHKDPSYWPFITSPTPLPPSLSLNFLAITNLPSISKMLYFQNCHINGIV